jgi:uncharacterized protein YjbI with pentapeptide repeats
MIAKPLFRIVGVILFICLLGLIIAGYWFNWHWTGLVPETSEPKQHAKTLWDWLNLLGVLAIPVVVALGASLFTARQEEANRKQRELELDIALDNQREAILQEYINKISELLLQEHLRKSQLEDEVRSIARVRTLTVLSRLDGTRKSNVLQFLYESALIDIKNRIINLQGADFSGVDLKLAILFGTDLRSSNFKEANLSGANLSGANLSETDLRMSMLIGAKLSGVDLTRAQLNSVSSSNIYRTVWLIGADLSGANLSGANLSRANLGESFSVERISKSEHDAILKLAHHLCDLVHLANKNSYTAIETDYSFTSIYNTTGFGPFFWKLKVEFHEKANLSGANLSGADLYETNLRGADLRGADLSKADLSKADLTDAIVNDEQLSKAKSLVGTIMPDGSVPHKIW